MDDATAKRYFDMYDKPNQAPEVDYKPNIQTTPQIEVDKRQYTRSTNTAKKITPNNGASTSNIPNNFPNNTPSYTPTMIPGKKFSINGKSIGDFIRDVVYYNPSNPLDPGNFADAVAVAAVTSEKYARGTFEKTVLTGGIIYGILKGKKYVYEKFVK